MALFEINRNLTNRQLRWFAGLWFPAFSALVGNIVLRISDSLAAAVSIWVVAGLLSITGLIFPRFIQPVYIGLSRLTFPIGWLLSHLLLGILYFAVITPLGFLVRMFHDPMERNFDKSARSYWKVREERSKDSYVRQF